MSRVSITVSAPEVITRTSYILDKLGLRARGRNVSSTVDVVVSVAYLLMWTNHRLVGVVT